MDINTVFRLAIALACPIAMGLMMWWMGKGMMGEHNAAQPKGQSAAERLAALRAQRETLEAEVAEAARIAELEAKRDSLKAAQTPAPEANG